ncbi:ea2ae02f-bf5f-48ea-b119-0fd7763feec0 [Thermothielavioides terrestris]|uniref:MARVEL domain-containing protein n=2 Tax=Thermothielavioides terrestris TaxID=2587410 RepID=G2R8P2_THETT|nr:uncharacterized protein THITE_2117695 [Thermothielavioides terrestris NRRL 8126]AEO68258.1 hypothetical protein THITE_2117695 [Thermothielavioides terrestris NRRL 8126]SPQ24486.1 ea2ae02f-bf5f-48ea-b119-0fd7763feec0 [Thermothielavioides terrestris]
MSAPYVVGEASPFLKRVLIPFWIVRILLMILLIGLYLFVIVGLHAFKDDIHKLEVQYNTHLDYKAVYIVSSVIIALVSFSLLGDVVCIVKRARRTLSPPFFLWVNVIQSTFFVAYIILSFVGPRNGAISIAIGVVVLLSFLGLLIYAGVVYHQYRTGALGYQRTSDPETRNLVPKQLHPQPYAHNYPRTDYYDQHAAAETQAYSGQGYAAEKKEHPLTEEREVHDGQR